MLCLSCFEGRSGRPSLGVQVTTFVATALAVALAVALVWAPSAHAQPSLLTRTGDGWGCDAPTPCASTSGCAAGATCSVVGPPGVTPPVCLPPGGGVLCCTEESDCQVDGVIGTCQSISDGAHVCLFGTSPFCTASPSDADALRCYSVGTTMVTDWVLGDCDGDLVPNGSDLCPCEMGDPATGCESVVDGGVTASDGGVATRDGGPEVDTDGGTVAPGEDAGSAMGGNDAGGGIDGIDGGGRASGGFEGGGGCGCRVVRASPNGERPTAGIAFGLSSVAFGLYVVARKRRAEPARIESAHIAAMSGPMTSATTLISLTRMLSDGPAVSLKGSPTVSPTTAALCASEPFLCTVPSFIL